MTKKCDPKDIALKYYFLGPRAENQKVLSSSIHECLARWMEWRQALHPEDGAVISASDQQEEVFLQNGNRFHAQMDSLLSRYAAEIPTFSPRYMGHMCSELSISGMVGHFIALLHNPNNVASEASRVGLEIEREAISDLACMLGWDSKEAMGHFTSGGSVANFEAIYRARERDESHFHNDESVVLVPKNRHYSWLKGCKVFGIRESRVWQVELNEQGSMDIADLSLKIELAHTKNKRVMLLVSVMGSTELGAIDDIQGVCDSVRGGKFLGGRSPWLHVDGAYGGFFCSIEPQSVDVEFDSLFRTLQAIKHVNSMTLDPHKLAYVPYSCGAFICQSKNDYRITQVKAPYLENHDDVDRGLFTLEGSRAATGASATWLTSRTLGFHREGLGRILSKTLSYRECFKQEISNIIPQSYVIDAGLTNILGLVIAKEGERLSETNRRTLEVYRKFSSYAGSSFILSKTVLMLHDYEKLLNKQLLRWGGIDDVNELAILRFCLLNPFLKTKESERDFLRKACEELKNSL